MRIPAESLSGTSVRDKVVTAAEAVRLIRDGDWVVVEGFVGQCFAEELTLALEKRHQLRQLLPGPSPGRRLQSPDPLAGRALLRQRDQVHDQLLHAAQAQRALVRPGPGPAHL